MWEWDFKDSWAQKNWCFWTVVLEQTLENPLDCKEIQPVHPKEDQSWVFTGRTDVEAETPILWPPYTKNWLIWKDLMLGKIEGGRRRGQERMRWLEGINGRVWVNSESWWWTVRPGMLQSVVSQRVGHDWATELNWTENILGWSCLQPTAASLKIRCRVVLCESIKNDKHYTKSFSKLLWFKVSNLELGLVCFSALQYAVTWGRFKKLYLNVPQGSQS